MPASVIPRNGIEPLVSLLDRVRSAPEGESAAAAFSAAVRKRVSEFGLIRRPADLAALAANPAFRMKYREKPAHRRDLSDAAWERFALSLGDCHANRVFSDLLPALAAVVRLENDPALLDHLRRQLEELASWSPLMRPGWSSGSAADGAWLGTGWAVRAIFWSLALLPDSALSPGLRSALDERLRAEAAAIRDDWTTGRSWFIRDQAVYSNQWVLPLEALVLAGIRLGLDSHRDDHEFGVANLLRTLDAQGPDGEFVEGMEYGAITLHSLHSAARAAAEAGDDRLLSHPYLRAFPRWYLHHRQPAGQVINAFDNLAQELDPELLSRAVTDLRHGEAAWALSRRRPEPTGVFSLAALPLLAEVSRPPPLFAAYAVATRVNWLESHAAFDSGPASRVSGFWIRGGHASDAHDHQDRGHVNLVVAGRPVLIEAGHASYGLPEHPTHFRGVAGHNVLQVGPHAPAALTREVLAAGAGQLLDADHRAAPLTVRRLDATGGLVEFDGSRCYAGLVRWTRRVEWDAASAAIVDEVELASPEIVVFRWHLGAAADAKAEFIPGGVRVDDIVLACAGRGDEDVPVTLSLEPMPDRTLQIDRIGSHATVVARTASPVRRLVLRTRASLAR